MNDLEMDFFFFFLHSNESQKGVYVSKSYWPAKGRGKEEGNTESVTKEKDAYA